MGQKNRIEDAIKALLLSDTLGTQEELAAALELQGYSVNQSKISRLLRKLGAVKVTNEKRQIVYSMPREPAPPTSKNIFSQLIMNITHNETLIVIHTNPGSASMVGRLLDHNREDLQILGTVAGDDTVFIAPESVKKLEKTLEAIHAFLAEMT